jgi:hypothetical protein
MINQKLIQKNFIKKILQFLIQNLIVKEIYQLIIKLNLQNYLLMVNL